MNTFLLSQFSNFGESNSVASAIVSLLRSSSYTKIRIMVAFANYGGVSGLAEEISSAQIPDKSGAPGFFRG